MPHASGAREERGHGLTAEQRGHMDSVPNSKPAEGTCAERQHGVIRLGGGAMWAVGEGRCVPRAQPAAHPPPST